MTLSHLPTLLLLIGYPAYWIELYCLKHPSGHTTWTASIIFVIMACMLLCRKQFSFQFPVENRFFGVAGVLAAIIVIVAGMASFLPPHLLQEYDALNYHITIPRQHLLTGSFAHLPWSVADFFMLPVDFALAPYWLATELPNKWPQFLFLLALPFVVGNLVRKLGGSWQHAGLAGFLILGSHGIGIQAGTAMLDVALCYLFLAALDSFLKNYVILAAIEMAFFVFAKPALPVMFLALVICMGIWMWLAFRLKWVERWSWGFLPEQPGLGKGVIKKFCISFFCAGIVIGGPFMAKSLFYTGTPFYPISVGSFYPLKDQPEGVIQEIKDTGKKHWMIKDQYADSRGLKAFLAHFWWVAVPEQGVNNRFDYPLGLPLLLVLFPFGLFLATALKARHLPLIPLVCVLLWIFWWMGTRQGRFLFVPMGLMIVATSAALSILPRMLWVGVIIALGLTALSVWRAHAPDFGKSQWQILRVQDRHLLETSKTIRPGERVQVSSPDMAFASFIVDVKKEKDLFVFTQ